MAGSIRDLFFLFIGKQLSQNLCGFIRPFETSRSTRAQRRSGCSSATVLPNPQSDAAQGSAGFSPDRLAASCQHPDARNFAKAGPATACTAASRDRHSALTPCTGSFPTIAASMPNRHTIASGACRKTRCAAAYEPSLGLVGILSQTDFRDLR